MFDTMTVTKAASGFLGAFLAFLLLKWAAEIVYHTDGHGEASYVIEAAEAATAEPEEEVSFEELMAAADVEKGAKVFKKCSACHKLEDGANSTGPHLFGIVSRPVAEVADFKYSEAMKEKGGEWTQEALYDFLVKPAADVPGTSMSFSGLKKEKDRVNLIAYLQTIGG